MNIQKIQNNQIDDIYFSSSLNIIKQAMNNCCQLNNLKNQIKLINLNINFAQLKPNIKRCNNNINKQKKNFGYNLYYYCIIFVLFLLIQKIKLNNAQIISTKSQKIEARIGESVQLPCTFSELDSDDKVVLWKRGLDVLTIDEETTTGEQRFQVIHDGMDYNLSISKLESHDSESYTCSVTSNPPVEITHTLQVNVPPTAKIIPSTSIISARVGEEIVVKCTATGNPIPKISWNRVKTGTNSIHTTTGSGHLIFAKATPTDSGIYECRSSNGISPDSIVTVEIRVTSDKLSSLTSNENNANDKDKSETAPWVETDKLYIPVTLDSTTNLSCLFDGQPEPTADWLYNGFKINKNEKKFRTSTQLTRRNKNSITTTFLIKDIHEDHFGDYTCKISNAFGTVERTIHLSGRPGPPQITIDNDNNLLWIVESAKPIIEYKVHFRLASDDIWKDFKIISSKNEDQDGDVWTSKTSLLFLKPNTDYELQVSAKNNLGWGSLARSFINYKSSNKNDKIQSNALDVNINGKSRSKNLFKFTQTLINSLIFIVIPLVLYR